MITVKAVYENGSIMLLEDTPLQERQQLLITLIDEETSDIAIRSISLQQPDSFREYLSDEQEDLYQDYLKLIK